MSETRRHSLEVFPRSISSAMQVEHDYISIRVSPRSIRDHKEEEAYAYLINHNHEKNSKNLAQVWVQRAGFFYIARQRINSSGKSPSLVGLSFNKERADRYAHNRAMKIANSKGLLIRDNSEVDKIALEEKLKEREQMQRELEA